MAPKANLLRWETSKTTQRSVPMGLDNCFSQQAGRLESNAVSRTYRTFRKISRRKQGVLASPRTVSSMPERSNNVSHRITNKLRCKAHRIMTGVIRPRFCIQGLLLSSRSKQMQTCKFGRFVLTSINAVSRCVEGNRF